MRTGSARRCRRVRGYPCFCSVRRKSIGSKPHYFAPQRILEVLISILKSSGIDRRRRYWFSARTHWNFKLTFNMLFPIKVMMVFNPVKMHHSCIVSFITPVPCRKPSIRPTKREAATIWKFDAKPFWAIKRKRNRKLFSGCRPMPTFLRICFPHLIQNCGIYNVVFINLALVASPGNQCSNDRTGYE